MSDRVMAGMQDIHGRAISRDEWAAHLEKGLDAPDQQDQVHTKAANLYVAAGLLDELAAVYKGEPLGRLARQMAVTFYDRVGI